MSPRILPSQTLTLFRRHLNTYTTFSQCIPPPSAHPQCTVISSETLAVFKSLRLLTYLNSLRTRYQWLGLPLNAWLSIKILVLINTVTVRRA